MRLNFPTDLFERMTAHLVAAYPNEGCGLLIGRRQGEEFFITEVRPALNLQRERAHDRFELDPKAFLQAERELEGREEEVLGFFHSHPDWPARPSATDRERAWPDYLYLIQSILQGRAGEATVWAFVGEEKEPMAVELRVGEAPLATLSDPHMGCHNEGKGMDDERREET